jgi:hypothetical protein
MKDIEGVEKPVMHACGQLSLPFNPPHTKCLLNIQLICVVTCTSPLS